MEEPAERVWQHLKQAAAEWSAAGKAPPVDGDSMAAVRRVLAQEQVTVPPSTLEFYAAEFTEMVRGRSK